MSKVHIWSLWLTKILDLVPSFPKVHGWSLWFAFCNAFSPQLLVTKCVTKCKPQGPSRYFWQKLGTKCVTKYKPQRPSMYFWKAGD
ncbi:hypothetical protein Hanom_Chr07g00592071 [Helianthus anomalus]